MNRIFIPIGRSVVFTLLAVVASSAGAADGEALYTQKACMTCHGPAGDKPIMGMYPKLGGQNKEYLIQQMKDIKSGRRDNGQSAVMKPMMTSVSDEEITAIAEYLSSQ